MLWFYFFLIPYSSGPFFLELHEQPAVPRCNAMFHGAMSCFAAFSPPCTALPVTAKHCRPDMQCLPEWTRSLVRACVSLYRVSMTKNFAFKVNSLLRELSVCSIGLWIRLLSYLTQPLNLCFLNFSFFYTVLGLWCSCRHEATGDVCRHQESGWIQVFKKQSLQCQIDPWEKPALKAL